VSDTRSSAIPSPGTEIAWTAEVRPSAGAAPELPPPAPLTGRMSVGGPRPDAILGAATPLNNRARMAAFGDTAAQSGASYAYATGSLTDADDPSSEMDAANLPPPPVVAPAAPRVVKASKPAKRSASRTRSVEQIFMHPLGRM
jgi:hypothetical protein